MHSKAAAQCTLIASGTDNFPYSSTDHHICLYVMSVIAASEHVYALCKQNMQLLVSLSS